MTPHHRRLFLYNCTRERVLSVNKTRSKAEYSEEGFLRSPTSVFCKSHNIFVQLRCLGFQPSSSQFLFSSNTDAGILPQKIQAQGRVINQHGSVPRWCCGGGAAKSVQGKVAHECSKRCRKTTDEVIESSWSFGDQKVFDDFFRRHWEQNRVLSVCVGGGIRI